MKILVNDFCGHPFQIQLSCALAQAGHSVHHTYFSGNNTPKGATEATGENLTIDGVGIGREFHKHSILSRRQADISYGEAVRDRVQAFRPEIVLSANMPLDAQKILLRATHDCGGKFVFWLQDVLSNAIEFVFRKKHVPFAHVAGMFYGRMERSLLEQSDAVVCIAPEFRGLLQRWQIVPEKTFVIENWAPLDEVSPLSKPTPWAHEHGFDGKFCFMYSGTLGMKHKPDLLLELARQYESREDVVVVVIAQGAGADWLRKQQHTIKPGVLHVLPFQPYDRLSEVLASSDVLITLLDDDCGGFAVPSKTLAYMCAGRALLVSAPLENLCGQLVRRAGAGKSVSSTLDEFLAAAKELLQSEDARRRYGISARSYAEQTFGINAIRDRFLDVFAFAAGADPTRGIEANSKKWQVPISG